MLLCVYISAFIQSAEHLQAPVHDSLAFLYLHLCEKHLELQPQVMSCIQDTGTAGSFESTDFSSPSLNPHPIVVAGGRFGCLVVASIQIMLW